jgi:hypothetical protein
MRLSLTADQDGSAIGLADENGRPRAGLFYAKGAGLSVFQTDSGATRDTQARNRIARPTPVQSSFRRARRSNLRVALTV